MSASEKQYKQLAKKVEAKVKRIQKNYGVDLTNELKIPEFSKMNSKQRTEQKEKMKSFTNPYNPKYRFRKNEYGLVMSQAEIDRANRNTSLIQRKVDKMTKEIESKQIIGSKRNVGDINRIVKHTAAERLGITRPEKFNFNQWRDRKRLDRRLELLEKKARGNYYDEKFDQLKENVIVKLDTLFNNFTSDEIVSLLRQLSPEEFSEFYTRSKNVKIEDYPDTLGQADDSNYTQLGYLLDDLRFYIREKDGSNYGHLLEDL